MKGSGHKHEGLSLAGAGLAAGAVVAAATGALDLVFHFVDKNGISVWELQMATIVVGGLLAALMTVVVLRRRHLLVARLVREADERRKVEDELRVTVADLGAMESILGRSPAAVFVWRPGGDWAVDYAGGNVAQFGFAPQDFTSGRVSYDRIVHPDDRARLEAEEAARDESRGEEYTQEYRIVTPSGDVRWIHDRTLMRRDGAGNVVAHEGIVVDVTEARLAEAALRESEELFRGVYDKSPVGFEVYDPEGWLTGMNRACQRLMGTPTARRVFDLPCLDDEARAAIRAGHAVRCEGVPIAENGSRHLCASGPTTEPATAYVDVEVTPVHGDGQRPGSIGYLVQYLDITARKRIELEIRQLAFHDQLTGLPNRRLFEDRLRMALAQRRRHEGGLAVLFMDCDNFKAINDELGHEAGDQMLAGVARRLEQALREGDTVARMGGDEFTMLLPGVSCDDDARRVVNRILAGLAEPFELGGVATPMSLSIGISMSPRDGDDAETLLRAADTAMYLVKEHGRHDYAFHVA